LSANFSKSDAIKYMKSDISEDNIEYKQILLKIKLDNTGTLRQSDSKKIKASAMLLNEKVSLQPDEDQLLFMSPLFEWTEPNYNF
jgi:hypothetical protein